MTLAGYLLMLLAVVLGAEALWGSVAPRSMRARMRKLLDESGAGQAALHRFCWGAALVLWAVAWTGQSREHRTLFVLGVAGLIGGFFGQRPGALEAWYGLVLGRRSVTAIRFIYGLEWTLACGLAWIALRSAG